MTKVYMETSLFGFFYDDGAPKKREAVRSLFARVQGRTLEGFTSATTVGELQRSRSALAVRLLSLLQDTGIQVVPDTPEVVELARAYLAAGIVPEDYPEDATHVASGSLHRADVIATLNLRHLARASVVSRINILNRERGLVPVAILTPEMIP